MLHQCRTLLLLHCQCPPPALNRAIALIIIIFFVPLRSSSYLHRHAHHHLCAATLIIFFAPSRSSYSLCHHDHLHLHAVMGSSIMIIFIFMPPSTQASLQHHALKLHCPLSALMLCVYPRFSDPLYLTPCVLWHRIDLPIAS